MTFKEQIEAASAKATLARLLDRYEELVGRAYRGTLEVPGQAEKYEADLRLAIDVRAGKLLVIEDEAEAVRRMAQAWVDHFAVNYGDVRDEGSAPSEIDLDCATAALAALKGESA